MIKLKSFVLSFLIILISSFDILSIDYSKSNFTRNIGVLALTSGVALSGSVLFYKKNQKFREKVKSIKEKLEDKFIDDIVIPVAIKWQELKEDKNLVKKGSVVTATLAIAAITYLNKDKIKNYCVKILLD